MTHRIGTLHVDYRANVRDRAATAMAPHLDRLLTARLADAIDARLPALLGDDQEVIVIKEVRARAAIRQADLAMDGRIIDAVGRSTIEAIATVLAAPASDEQIVRFADPAAFIGSFIVDLLQGSAWDRWYFGAFHRYRQGDEGLTIGAVLDEHREYAAAVFGWLARRGHLDAVLARLGPERASRLAMPRDSDRTVADSHHEVTPLVAAAFRLIEAMGWTIDDALRARLSSAYLDTTPILPTWTDRRSLTSWILRFIHFAVAGLGRGQALRSIPPPDFFAQLRTHLDWLDFDWLSPQLEHLSASGSSSPASPSRSTRRILTARHEQALARLAELIRLGRVRLSAIDDAAAISVRLMAALADGGVAGANTPDRAMALAIERIARALMAALRIGWDAQRVLHVIEGGALSTPASTSASALAKDVDDVSDMGPAAQDVLRRLVVATVTADAGESTPAAGLFLVTRAMLDIRLHVLARDADVPFEPLRAALAAHWLDLSPPFDPATALWIGRPPETPGPALATPDALAALEFQLGSLLRQQRAGNDMPATEANAVGRIGGLVLRAWSRWLPGIAHASPPFLVKNCLRRQARARVTPTTVDLQIGAAPLDVTLDMAGYFRPIARVPWLDGRTVTFTKRRGA